MHKSRFLSLAFLIAFSLTVGAAWGQSVVINGVPLVTTRTPVTFAGTMLLPMRDVFEALNSEIKWFASEQKIVATRGNTVIQLWIGRPEATIDGRPVKLPVAPTLIGGSTYVPLRFPAETFGGTVKWDPATRTALIEIPQIGASAPPATPPTTPPTPLSTTVEGSVIQVVRNPAGVVLQTADNTGLLAVSVNQSTVITRNPADAAPAAARFADVRVGDYAQAVLAEGNVTVRLALTYGQATGRVVAITGNALVLDDGNAYRLSDQVRVTDLAGKPVPLTCLTQNTPVQIVFGPRSKVVWELHTTSAAPTVLLPLPGPPQILTVGVLNNNTYFRRGDMLRLQITGTPGGQASISLGPGGRLARDIPLQEVQPGLYQAQVVVPDVPDARSQAIVGNLSVGGVRTQSVVSPTCLTIDNTPPVIAGMLPAQGQVVSNSTPVIQITFGPDHGSPLDPRSVRMFVNRVDVSNQVQGDAEAVSYVPEALRPGLVTVEFSVRDLAGNESRLNWAFTIGFTGDTVIGAVWHTGRATLVAGNILTVNARVFNPGGVATFSLGNLRQNLPMQQMGNTNTYRGIYLVCPGDRLLDGLVSVTYREPQGRQGTMDATARANIDTSLPAGLAITAPADLSQVGDLIIVNGEAPPYAPVRVTITYTTKILAQITGQVWQGVVTTDRRGLWSTPEIGSSLGILGRADNYTILAELLDANGRTLSQQQIRLHR